MPRKLAVSSSRKTFPQNGRKLSAKMVFPENECAGSETPSSDQQDSPPKAKLFKDGPSMSKGEVAVNNDFGKEMTNLLQGFSNDITKTLQSKRKRVQQYTEESIRTTSKKVLEVSKAQSVERRRVCDEFRMQMHAVLAQEENVLEKVKEAEDKIRKVTEQQQKQLAQMRNERNQHIKLVKEMANSFFKGMEDLEVMHVEQYANVHNDMRKEMANLQKKLMMDTQQQEMMNVRKQLQNMLD